ncbi:sigma 54-interacting transcriptional regulator [Kroppenstedtia eburnea]|uniref:Transcriptional regulatory protein LevR, contains PRD, AAA+ and EIIA domains n=1 Tax=Kroppenstedtia eburnea TaxID=714067 RepID=A0A1N7PX36_9BACL|nr:sigma-54-dependent transcriptional regulator [Kroppenstedtia eburnea]EGK09166.1 BglG family transcription antiterminator [Desmospora sp. 8437]QKI80903.1 PRD domain-containing protein [Kroppenstedtia eburnea]SIT15130.1 Transcriptional regulatory protein LevR, contains PRD, AAA+ and EIIA domains [Kroppenstedtia eburnea]
MRKLDELGANTEISAGELADLLELDRANVSRLLNQLWREGKVVKRAGRPVLFTAAGREYSPPARTTLDRLLGVDGSLKNVIQQGKAALLYPPHGMHILLLGETGVGKSMLAECLHRYAIEVDRLADDAPFVIFNCADYANNPQLLLGQLFGVHRGAFTGAREQKGMIEKAHGGILFLDEVHRLPAEGQEMLFTLIDKGSYRRLGESETERNARVLLIAATTEDTDSGLLRTFKRRIPMVIRIPPLRERSVEERYRLVLHFFKEEAIRLGKEIHVSANTIRALLYYPCLNNIGQLKTDIQLTCAKVYADFVSAKKGRVQIHSSDLPPVAKEGLLLSKGSRKRVDIHDGLYLFHPRQADTLFAVAPEDPSPSVYKKIEKRYNELKSRGLQEDELHSLMAIDIENYFTQYFKRMNRKLGKGNLAKLVNPAMIGLTEKIVRYAEAKLGTKLSEKVMQGLALHIQTSIQRIENGKTIVNPQLNHLRRMYKEEFGVALDCIKMIEEKTGVDVPIDEAGFLTMFFVLDDADAEDAEESVHILVISHGNSGATTMAEVTRELLGTEGPAAIDMPLHMDPIEIYEQTKNHLKKHATDRGVLLMVDMGSLMTFGEMLEGELGIPIRTLPMVSTPHVLEATRKAILGYSLEQLVDDIKQLTLFDSDPPLKNGSDRGNKRAIVTMCSSGHGDPHTIQKVLTKHLSFDPDGLEIIYLESTDREELERKLLHLKQSRPIVCIVSDFFVRLDLRQFHMDEVIHLQGIERIQHLIDTEEAYDKMADTLQHHLLHADPGQVVPDVKSCFEELQQRLKVSVPTKDLIGMVLHACCMVDRLLAGDSTVIFKNKEEYIRSHPSLYTTTRNVLSRLETTYRIQLSDDEICYMMSFFDSSKRTSS